MNRRSHRPATRAAVVLSAAVASLALTTGAHAADLFWQGGTADLGASNYTDPISASPNLAPGGSDALYIGADGTATRSTDMTVGRIIVGHNGNTTEGAPGLFPGAGTVEITGGNLNTTTGAGATVGLVVGHSANGSFSITNASVTVNDGVVVGSSATDATINASLNVNAGGSLTLSTGGIQLGLNGSATVAGAGGNMTVAGGTVSVPAATFDLVVGVWNKSTYTQTGGTVTIADDTFVGRRNADFSSFTLSGGSFTTGDAFNVADTSGDGRIDDVTVSVTNATLNVGGLLGMGAGNSRRATMTIGQGANVSVNGTINVAGNSNAPAAPTVPTASAAVDTTLVIQGNANVNAASFSVGHGTANRTTLTITDDAVVISRGNLVIANQNNPPAGPPPGILAGSSNNSTFNLSGNAKVTVGDPAGTTSSRHLFLGRGTSTNTTFNMSGTSSLTIEDLFLMGTGPSPTGIVVNHSGGILTVGGDVRVNDTSSGTSTYNLSGTGEIVSPGGIYVGRQKGLGTFNQTGGTATHNSSVRIGDAQNVDKTFWGTGVYNMSAGTLNATSAFTALSIAPQGTGTFRVIGDDAVINLTGNVLVNTTAADGTFPAFTGTLAYRLEAGDAGLSTVAATGTATFNAGAVLQLDFNSVKPVQGVYNVLTASDVIDNGLTKSLPAGWNLQIVPSTGGKTLRFIAGDFNSDAIINADDLVWIDRGRAMGLTGGANGDLNADGVIDAEDYQLIDQAYGATNTLSPGFLAARASEFGDAYVSQLVAAVPEPSSLLAAGALALPALTRRRRSR